MTIVLLVGGSLDMIFDGWTFFDGVYFNFIALSTIGFGDLFPRVEHSKKLDKLGFSENGKRIFASTIMIVYMIIGLSIVSTVIYAIVKAIEEISQVKVCWGHSVIGSELNSASPNLLMFQNGCPKPVVTKKISSSKPEIFVIPASDSEITQINEEKQGSDLELHIIEMQSNHPLDSVIDSEPATILENTIDN